MDSPAQYRDAWLERDRFWARRLHQAASYQPLVKLLVVVSAISDGLIWALLAPLFWMFGGAAGEQCARLMLLLGAINIVIYWALKQGTSRPRPYIQCQDIRACTRALDQFSFPSGHTLHAVSFTLLIHFYYPMLAAVLWVFTGLVALSRIVLGLHYPSDVLAAIGIGLFTGSAMLSLAFVAT